MVHVIICGVLFAGRRSCLGEQLARQKLFVFIATILHRFKIKLPEGTTPNYQPVDDIIMKPNPYQIIFESRLWCGF